MNNITIKHAPAGQYKAQIIRLWKECLPGTQGERFEWMVSGNPAGPTEWFLAFDDRQVLVATSSVMPKDFFFNGRKIRGGIIGDIMVASGFRKRGIAQQIQQVIADSSQLMRMEFFYVVPNVKSKNVFSQSVIKQDFRLKYYLIPVDVGYYFNKIPFCFSIPRINRCIEFFLKKAFCLHGSCDVCNISIETDFDEEVDTLWKSMRDAPNLLVGSKSAAYLNWKYCSKQSGHFRILKCRISTGLLVGYCVYSIVDEKIHIYEFVCSKKKHYAHLMSALRSVAKTESCVGVYFYSSKENPVIKALWWRGLFRIGGDMNILCIGKIFEKPLPWLFFPGDRNL